MFRLYFMAFTMQIVTASVYPYAQILLRNMGFSQSVIGIILACGQLSSCFVPLFVSNLADKTGKTKIMYLCSALFMALSYVILMNIPKLPVVFAFFIIAYACSGSMTTLGDTLINQSIAKIGGSYSSARATGTFGYVLVLILFSLIDFPDSSSNSEILKSIIYSSVLLLFAISISINPVKELKDKQKRDIFFDVNWFDKSFYLLIIITFIKSIGNSAVDKFLGSYMTEVLMLGNKFTIFVALGGFAEFLFMLFGGQLLNKGKISEYTLITLSSAGLMIRLLLYVVSKNIYVFAFAQLFHCLTFAASHIAIFSYISKYVDKNHISLATAIYSSIALTAPQFLGSLCGGFIIDNLGYSLLFAIYSLFGAASLILCFCFKKRIKV